MIVVTPARTLPASARAAWLLVMALTGLPALAQERQPAPPYYSVQLATAAGEGAAIQSLQPLADQPSARAEERDGAHLVRVGVFADAQAARVERDAWRARGMPDARVVKVTRAVDWLTPRGVRIAAASSPGEAAAAAPVAASTGAEPAPLELADAGGTANWASTLVSLERIGMAEGFALEGSQGRRTLFFPVPPGVDVARAQLMFDLDFSELLIPPSGVQFRVNGSLRRAVRRGSSGTLQRVEIPLTRADLEEHFIAVEMEYSLFVHEDTCLSRKLAGAYVLLSPASGLAVVARDAVPRSVRAAWSMLPREVTVAARLGEMTPAEFQALFHVATLLHRLGHLVKLEALAGSAGGAHIVIAPADRYVRDGAGSANLRMVRSRGPARPDGSREARGFILVDGTRPLPAADMLAQPWRDGASGAAVDVAVAESWPQPRDLDTVVRLKDLGFADAERVFNFSAEWQIGLPFGPLGEGQRPARVELDVFGPRIGQVRGQTFVSAYYNDRLVYSAALKGEGGKETLEFELPRVQLRARNNLKVVAQRDETGDDCSVSQAAYPLSISPESVVETRPLNETPVTFAELVPHQRSLEVHVAKDVLAQADRVVPMLVALGEHFWPDVAAPELRLFEPGAELEPAGPFFVIGEPRWSPRALVQLDKGRVAVRSNATGEPLVLLDFASDVPTTILQMVEADGHGGAWLRSTGAYANVPSKRALFEDENVAFLDSRGVQSALRVGSTRDYRVDYPDATGWFSATGAWRTVLFVIAWVVVLGLLIYLYRRTRRHREL